MIKIGIDGLSGSGKGALAGAVAKHFNLKHLDTGAIFRGIACGFVELGFEVIGTEGTINFLSKRGVNGKVVAKIGEGRPDVLDAIKNREINLIINTPSGRRDARADDCRIRQAAIKYSVPYLTTLAAASAAAEGIAAAMNGKGEVRSLQSYHAAIG